MQFGERVEGVRCRKSSEPLSGTSRTGDPAKPRNAAICNPRPPAPTAAGQHLSNIAWQHHRLGFYFRFEADLTALASSGSDPGCVKTCTDEKSLKSFFLTGEQNSNGHFRIGVFTRPGPYAILKASANFGNDGS